MSAIWEQKIDCGISCHFPDVCWEPKDFTSPNICLPASVNPNSFTNYLSFSESNVVLLATLPFFGGISFGFPSLIRVIRQNRAFVMSALIWGLILDVRRQLPLLFAFLPEGIRSFEWAHMASKCLLLLTILIGIIDLLIF
uniref:Uncharacterized protein n=1 Tax=Globodera rostochiensis TaxID=31243 RepID=A0A914HPI3_GLORO